MPPKAVKALDTQLALIRYYGTGDGEEAFQGFIESTRRPDSIHTQMFRPSETGERLAHREKDRLNKATTFFVENDMLTLAAHASYTMPRQKLLYSDLPCDRGFVLFETPILITDSRGRTVSVAAISWGPGVEVDWIGNNNPGVNLMFYSDIEDPRDTQHKELSDLRKRAREELNFNISRYSLFHVSNIVYGIDLGELTLHKIVEEDLDGTWVTVPYSDINNEESGTVDMHRFFYCFLVLSQQRIASIQRTHLDRHSQRRMKRGMTEPPEDGTIQVVSLRRYSPPKDKEYDEGLPVNWTHRWIVNGFWRNQYYPSVDEHRLMWINDYIKGPEDLPLVVKNKIYDLRR